MRDDEEGQAFEGGNVRAVERAAAILQSFTRLSPVKSVAELQSELGLSRPTLYRLLQTLEKQGFVRGSGEPLRYSLDHKVLALADAWMAQVDVMRCADEQLAELWARTDETVGLYVPLEEGSRLAVKELRSKQPLSLSLGIGRIVPLTEGASGWVMLAYFEPERREALLRTIPEGHKREQLRELLEKIVHRGYSITVGQRIAGAVAIAAPIFDHDGNVAASLCLMGPEARLTEDFLARYASLVVNCAAEVSTQMGHRGHPRYPMVAAPAREGVS